MTEQQKRQILSLRAQGLSFSQISCALHMPIGTVKSFIFRSCRGDKEERGSSVLQPACQQCGRPLLSSNSHSIKRFCSDQCRARWWNRHRDLSRRPSAHTQKCPCCGAQFYTYAGRYCSRACYGKARSIKAGVSHE